MSLLKFKMRLEYDRRAMESMHECSARRYSRKSCEKSGTSETGESSRFSEFWTPAFGLRTVGDWRPSFRRLSLSEEQRDSSGSGTGTAEDGGASPLGSTCYIVIF